MNKYTLYAGSATMIIGGWVVILMGNESLGNISVMVGSGLMWQGLAVK